MASSVVRKCSWISVVPSSSRSTGPATLSTVVTSGRAGVPFRLVPILEHPPDHDADAGDDQGDQEPEDDHALEAVPEHGTERQHDREEERNVFGTTGSGVPEPEAGQEEQHVPENHALLVPRGIHAETGQPGLEPGTSGFGDRCTSHCATAPTSNRF